MAAQKETTSRSEPAPAVSELFLVLKDLSRELHSLLIHLHDLSTKAPEADYLLGVDALYRADKDQALVCLRYSRVLAAGDRQQLVRLASHGGMPVLDPGRLSTSDQELFYQKHLGRYAVRIDDRKNPHVAVDALAQLLGLILPADELDKKIPVQSGRPSILLARAKGSKSEVGAIDLESMALGPAGKMGLEDNPRSQNNPMGKRHASERLPTIPARPQNTRSGPQSRTNVEDTLQVRYERGDRWMPARLRNLTLTQVRLAASAAPPLGARLRILLNTGSTRTTVAGVVIEVINTETSVDGSTSFRVEFTELPKPTRNQLAELLRRTQREGLTLSPPPARSNRRFAVTWPVTVVGSGQRIGATAHDVSECGLFLATTNLIRSRQVVFGIPVETKLLTIEGRATIAREVDGKMAKERNLCQGYGLHFESLSSSDRNAYESFLVRVKRRSKLHVLIAGKSAHNLALAKSFESAGYAVSLASSSRQLDRRQSAGTQRPDVALLGPTGNSPPEFWTKLKQTFDTAEVPVLHLSDHESATARATVDRLMNV